MKSIRWNGTPDEMAASMKAELKKWMEIRFAYK